MRIEGFEVGPYVVKDEGGKRVLVIDARNSFYTPSIADDRNARYHVLKVLTEAEADLVVLAEVYERVYDEDQTRMLSEVSAMYSRFEVDSIWSYSHLGDPRLEDEKGFGDRHNAIVKVTHDELLFDPIMSYILLLRELQNEKARLDSMPQERRAMVYYDTLAYIRQQFERTALIQRAKVLLSKLEKVPDTNDLYRSFFEAQVKPSFIGSRLVFGDEERLELLDEYSVKEAGVQIFKHPNKIEKLYFISLPEYSLTPEKYFLVSKTKETVATYQPGRASLSNLAKSRRYFERIYQSTIKDIAKKEKIGASNDEIVELSQIVARYTVGYGVLEVLLSDRRITDIYVDSPIGNRPIYLVHSEWGQCQTNVIYTQEEADSFVSKLRAMSGRPFDEAHPILDYDLPELETRVAAINPPLSSDGTAFAFRLHKTTPWTLAQFVDVKYLSPLSAGLLSFFIDSQATMLVTGSRGSGKTSLMSALMLEILQNTRIIVQEDSVTGDSEICIERNGLLEKTRVGELIDGLFGKHGFETLDGVEVLPSNPEGIKVYSMDAKGKMKLAPPSQFSRHRVSKDIFEVVTRTGRKIKVTGDHSLFGLVENKIAPIKCSELQEGSYVAIPRTIPWEGKGIRQFSLLNHLEFFEGGFVVGRNVREFISSNLSAVKKAASQSNYSQSLPFAWKRNSVLPVKIFRQFMHLIGHEGLLIKDSAKSKPIPATVEIDDNFLHIVGLWLADGSYDNKYGVIISTPDCGREIGEFAQKFGLIARGHSDGFSYILSNTALNLFFRKILCLEGNAYTKQFPAWVFTLSKEQLAQVLCGLYSGDGSVAEYEIQISLCSKSLIHSLQTLLLPFGIVCRTGTKESKVDKTTTCRISSVKMANAYQFSIGFLQEQKNRKLAKLCSRISTHDTTDIIPFSQQDKAKLWPVFENFNAADYIKRGNSTGRGKFSRMLFATTSTHASIEDLTTLIHSDIFWDEVKEINRLGNAERYVYDFSVPSGQSFLCNGIIAHNTAELPVEYMKNIGYNIQRLKTRSPIGTSENDNEVAPEDALRTALRLGDSALVIGEVRSSLRGNEEVVIVENGITKRVPIKDVEGKCWQDILVPTIDNSLKASLAPLTSFVKHPKRQKLLEVTTKTGRKVTVTHDHSLFTQNGFGIKPIECKDLEVGSRIVIPSAMPSGFNDLDWIDLTTYLHDFRVDNCRESIREAIRKIGWKEATRITGIKTGDIYNYFRKNQKCNMPLGMFTKLMHATGTSFDLSRVTLKRSRSNGLPAKLALDGDFCRFIGYYLSEGYINAGGTAVIISNTNPRILDDVVGMSRRIFNSEPFLRKTYGGGECTQVRIDNSALAQLLLRLGCGRTSADKRVPPLVFGLKKEKISQLLRGFYSGDGSFTYTMKTGHSITAYSKTKKLMEDVMYALLCFGIVGRIFKRANADLWIVEFKRIEDVKTFLSEIGFVQKSPVITGKAWPHSSVNMVEIPKDDLWENVAYSRKYRHLARFGKCSKYYLQKMIRQFDCNPSEKFKEFANGDFYLDEVASMREIKLKKPEYVYDLSVNSTERFIGGFGGILLHNTEAKTLYEAMRVGAAGNIVMGTIHGDSAYSVWDRIVNDLGVPTTSFKATDVVVVARPIRFRGSLERHRRVVQVTEVKKHWNTDPGEEGGLLDLMGYDTSKDNLELLEDNLKESDLFTRLSSVSGLGIDKIWKSIRMNAESKSFMVELKNEFKAPYLLEAENTSVLDNKLVLLKEEQLEEFGSVDYIEVLGKWKNWARKYAAERVKGRGQVG